MDKFPIIQMYRNAKNYLHDADLLRHNPNKKSDAAYLLDLLSFELLLKCLLRIFSVKIYKGHKYQYLFSELSSEIQERVIALAQDRMSTIADYSNINKILETWTQNFSNLRYPYEKYENLTEAEYDELGVAWVQGGCKEEDATFVFYPSELRGMNFALLSIINEKLEMK